jgi:hypothetical protein
MFGKLVWGLPRRVTKFSPASPPEVGIHKITRPFELDAG